MTESHATVRDMAAKFDSLECEVAALKVAFFSVLGHTAETAFFAAKKERSESR
jgi:hypothetical protein